MLCVRVNTQPARGWQRPAHGGLTDGREQGQSLGSASHCDWLPRDAQSSADSPSHQYHWAAPGKDPWPWWSGGGVLETRPAPSILEPSWVRAGPWPRLCSRFRANEVHPQRPGQGRDTRFRSHLAFASRAALISHPPSLCLHLLPAIAPLHSVAE